MFCLTCECLDLNVLTLIEYLTDRCPDQFFLKATESNKSIRKMINNRSVQKFDSNFQSFCFQIISSSNPTIQRGNTLYESIYFVMLV